MKQFKRSVIRNKHAFTLAEVLITIAIIGIIAVITIPAFISNYQKKVISVRIKKFVSTFSQAYNMAIATYGDAVSWKDCSIEDNKSSCTIRDGSAAMRILSFLNAIDYSNNIPDSYKENLKKNFEEVMGGGWPNWDKSKAWQLNDGSLIFNMNDWNLNNGNYATTFIVDINGLSRPNRLDKDIFCFVQVHTQLSSTLNPGFYNEYGILSKGLYMDGYGYFSRYNFDPETDCLEDSGSRLFRHFCASLLQTNGWEFPEYYPWKLY